MNENVSESKGQPRPAKSILQQNSSASDSRPLLVVRLARPIDHAKPCCDNLTAVHPRPGGMHAAELRCANCKAHRGWLRKEAFEFLTEAVRRWGAPEILTLMTIILETIQ